MLSYKLGRIFVHFGQIRLISFESRLPHICRNLFLAQVNGRARVISILLETIVDNYHQTWLHEDIQDADVHINGHTSFNRGKQRRRGRGIAMFFRQNAGRFDWNSFSTQLNNCIHMLRIASISFKIRLAQKAAIYQKE